MYGNYSFHMETNRLRHFCAVAEAGSLSKAADLLNITHGGLHKSLRVLESELGFKLTIQRGRGIEITPEGKRFYPRALGVLKCVEAAIKPETGDETQEIRVGGLEIFITALPKFLLQEPALENKVIAFQELPPGQLENSVRTGAVDIGVTYIPVPQEGVEHIRLTKFRMGIFASDPKFQTTKDADLPFVVPSSTVEQNPLDIRNRDGWLDSIFSRRVAYKASSLGAAVQIVLSGSAVIYMPAFLKILLGESVLELNMSIRPVFREAFVVLPLNREEGRKEKIVARALRACLRQS